MVGSFRRVRGLIEPPPRARLVDFAGTAFDSEDLQRVAATAPEARKQIRIIWTSPLIPLDPLVWRKDLDPAVKTKLYTFLMSYGRIGSADEIKTARQILSDLVWSPFHPSSDNQLLPIRVLEANKSLMKAQSDDKLSADEKEKQVAAIRADIAPDRAGDLAPANQSRNENRAGPRRCQRFDRRGNGRRPGGADDPDRARQGAG